MKCIILAGGSGDRLWPLSRKTYPKQFMEIQENRSLLQETVVRNMPYCEEFIIVTNQSYEFIVEGQMQAFQGLKYRCVFEETARNTAAPISLLAYLSNPSELLYVVASDTIIEGSAYRDSVLQAMELARRGNLVVFGIQADCPNTRFGYIRRDGEHVLEFREKPSYEEACQYVAEGNCLWNSGMFLMSAGDFIQELKLHEPELYQQCIKVASKIDLSQANLFLPMKLLNTLPAISVEKAVFEHSQIMKVLEAEYQWVDIDELEDILPYLSKGERKGVILKDCQQVSVVNRTKRQLVVADRLNDLMLINTEDALYVAPKGTDSDSIKELMQEQWQEYGAYFERNHKAYRHWGNYEVLSQGKGFLVKKVTIYPGQTIYSHMHGFRSEHWSIVSGNARITLAGVTKDYQTNESIYVPMGVFHQVSNLDEENLMIIEVGIGENIEESDVIQTNETKQPFFSRPAESISRLEPAYKDYLWGGTRLKEIYGKNCDYEIVAESWELSAHPAGQSVLAEGKYKGMRFGDYLKRIDKANLGWKCQAYEEFPILIKLIDTKSRLSVQVHPGDEFALVEEGEYGKNEMWYILDCEEGASLYCGFRKGITKEDVLSAIEEERLIDILQELNVHKGDTIFIPTGTVHAIGGGILICEIQQNSNSTYRIYDYGRRDKYGNLRELHLDKAMQVLDLDAKPEVLADIQETIKCNGYSKQLLGQCKYFESMKIEVWEEAQLLLEEASFTAIVIIEGQGRISTVDKTLEYRPGDTFFIPAGKGKLNLKGSCQMILTRV